MVGLTDIHEKQGATNILLSLDRDILSIHRSGLVGCFSASVTGQETGASE